jgi:hypothetical protein
MYVCMYACMYVVGLRVCRELLVCEGALYVCVYVCVGLRVLL